MGYKRQNKGHNGWYREALVNSLGNKCRKCGDINELHIHHITPRFLGGVNSIENLTLLCGKCHKLLHYGGLE